MDFLDKLFSRIEGFERRKTQLQDKGHDLSHCCEQVTMELITGIGLPDYVYGNNLKTGRRKMDILGRLTGYTDRRTGYQGMLLVTSQEDRQTVKFLKNRATLLAGKVISGTAVALIGVRNHGDPQRPPDHVIGLCGGDGKAYLVDVNTRQVLNIGDMSNTAITIKQALEINDICIFRRKNN